MKQKLYTAKELAEHLRVNPQTIYRWADEGLIQDFKIGKSRRFLLPEITIGGLKKGQNNGKENTGAEGA